MLCLRLEFLQQSTPQNDHRAVSVRSIQIKVLDIQSRYLVPCRQRMSQPERPRTRDRERNVFGSHTGKIGEPLPAAPRSFTWRRIKCQGC